MGHMRGYGGKVRNRGLKNVGMRLAKRQCTQSGVARKPSIVKVKAHARAKGHIRCAPLPRLHAKKSRGKSIPVRRSTRVRKPRKMLIRGEGRKC